MPTIGRYVLLEKLGQGGMGVVYRAQDPLLQRIVAIKVISTPIDADEERRERFFREARSAGHLSHKNIVTIHDLGEHEGQPYLAMEYLTGQDLAARMADPTRMSLRRKLDVACEICEGLEYAHAHGVIHRDIKPGNIFIADSGTVKLVDFGLARLVTSELTRSNVMMGTINYMSPEQVRGERVDHRADIFSTAVVLYELFSGHRAFVGESFAATMYKILEVPPQPLLEIDSSLPLDVVRIIEKALAKPRDERYQQIGDMLRDLSAYRFALTAMDSPAVIRRATPDARLASQTPMSGTPASPVPVAVEEGGSQPPASGSAAPVIISSPRLLVGGAVIVLMMAAAILWMTVGRPRPPAAVTPAPPIVATEPPITDLMQKTLSAFAAEDYSAAEQNARAVLARDPGNTAAQQLLQRSRAAAAAVSDGVKRAQALLDQGKFEDASRAAGAVLGVAPGNADAKRIMEAGSAGSHGRGAEEARAQVARAKAAARSAGAQRLSPRAYAAAVAAERDAEQLYRGARPGDATVKFYEASGLYRSAEVAAQNESAAHEAQARPDPAPAPQPPPPAPTDATRPQDTAALPQPPAGSASSPSVPPTVTTPVAPPPPPLPPPAAAPPTPAPSTAEAPARSTTPEADLTDLLGRYKSALEARDMSALRRIWPNLSGTPEARLRSEFDHARQISVDVLEPRIAVSGNTGTVSFLRHYLVLTTDGQRLRNDTRATMDIRRTGSAWVIEGIRFEPVR